MSTPEQIREFAAALAEGHRPRRKRDTMAYVEQYMIQCSACDRDLWQIWREGDPVVECTSWRLAVEMGLVEA